MPFSSIIQTAFHSIDNTSSATLTPHTKRAYFNIFSWEFLPHIFRKALCLNIYARNAEVGHTTQGMKNKTIPKMIAASLTNHQKWFLMCTK